VPASTKHTARHARQLFPKKTVDLPWLVQAERPQGSVVSYIFDTSRTVARTKIARDNAPHASLVQERFK